MDPVPAVQIPNEPSFILTVCLDLKIVKMQPDVGASCIYVTCYPSSCALRFAVHLSLLLSNAIAVGEQPSWLQCQC